MKHACVVILCHMPWQWTTDYINQTAYELAKHNTVICYHPFNSMSSERFFSVFKISYVFRKRKNNLFDYRGVQFIPGQRFPFIVSLNEILNVLLVRFRIWRLSREKTFSVRVLWFFHPYMYRIATRFGKSFQTVYDCVDYWTGNAHLTDDERRNISIDEQKSLRGASVVTVNSHVLYRIHKHIRSDIRVVPQGFRLASFSRPLTHQRRVSHVRPIVGYIGAINDRLDIRLLVNVATALKQFTFVLVGPVLDVPHYYEPRFLSELGTLFAMPNVSRIGNVSKDKIPRMISQFDIGMIPYRTDTLITRNCYPMKLFEYFYMGKPVVATSISELRRFPEFVFRGNTSDEWVKILTSLVAVPWPARYRKAQRDLAIDNSWEKKISAVSAGYS